MRKIDTYEVIVRGFVGRNNREKYGIFVVVGEVVNLG